jgi:predicted transcriptional regulator
MTELLEFAIHCAGGLSNERQDQAAPAILRFVEAEQGLEVTDDDHVASIRRGLAQIRRGEFASNEEIEAVYRSFE